jgi:ABC-type transporter Mla subunit MlaD
VKSAAEGAISVRKLFLVVIVLKVGSSVAGWYFASPWLLGFAVPIGLMLLYIALGLARPDDAVSDERFADSCYYLGFIFTVSSILVALLDIGSIGSKIGEISVRFAAAMVSTVLGLVVRVYLVNFRVDLHGATRDSETGVLDAARNFRRHLDLAVEQLREFQLLVSDACKSATIQTETAIRAAAAEQSRRITMSFDQMTAEHRKVVDETASHMKAASQTLSGALYEYAESLASGTAKFESTVQSYAAKLEQRLSQTGLPEDYFAARLDPALANVARAIDHTGQQVQSMASVFQDHTQRISTLLGNLAEAAEAWPRPPALAETDASQAAVVGQLARAVDQIGRALSDSSQASSAVDRSARAIATAVARQQETLAHLSAQIERIEIGRRMGPAALEQGLADPGQSASREEKPLRLFGTEI